MLILSCLSTTVYGCSTWEISYINSNLKVHNVQKLKALFEMKRNISFWIQSYVLYIRGRWNTSENSNKIPALDIAIAAEIFYSRFAKMFHWIRKFLFCCDRKKFVQTVRIKFLKKNRERNMGLMQQGRDGQDWWNIGWKKSNAVDFSGAYWKYGRSLQGFVTREGSGIIKWKSQSKKRRTLFPILVYEFWCVYWKSFGRNIFF